MMSLATISLHVLTLLATPTPASTMEAFDRRDFSSACPAFEAAAYGVDGHARAASCYYWWALDDDDRWDDVVRLWSRTEQLCRAGSKCQRRARMNRESAMEIVKARDERRTLLSEGATRKATASEYEAAWHRSEAALETIENSLDALAEQLNVELEAHASEETIERMMEEVTRLKEDRAKLRQTVRSLRRENKKLTKELEHWRQAAEQSAQEAVEWRQKYYEALNGLAHPRS